MDDDERTQDTWVPGESTTARVESGPNGAEADLPGANADVGLGDPNEGAAADPEPDPPSPEPTQTPTTRLYVLLECVDLADLVRSEAGSEDREPLLDELRGIEVYLIRGQADAGNHELAVRKVARGMPPGEHLMFPVPLKRWRPTPATVESDTKVSLR